MFPTGVACFIDELVRTRGLSREAITAEVVAIVREAATQALGAAYGSPARG